MRKYYIDLYLKLRRRQRMVEELARIIKTRLAVIEISKRNKEKQIEHDKMLKAAYINLKFSQKWK